MLSAQRALLGAVFPQLRAVLVSAECQQWRVQFYFDGEISSQNREAMEIAATEIVADSPFGAAWDEKFDRLDAPKPIPAISGFTPVFIRHEPES